MLTDAMTRFLVEKVLGWEPAGDEWRVPGMYPGRAFDYGHASTPDFTTWEGFGLLMTALIAHDNPPSIRPWDYPASWVVDLEAAAGGSRVSRVDPDLRVALALAAAKAYGEA